MAWRPYTEDKENSIDSLNSIKFINIPPATYIGVKWNDGEITWKHKEIIRRITEKKDKNRSADMLIYHLIKIQEKRYHKQHMKKRQKMRATKKNKEESTRKSKKESKFKASFRSSQVPDRWFRSNKTQNRRSSNRFKSDERVIDIDSDVEEDANVN